MRHLILWLMPLVITFSAHAEKISSPVEGEILLYIPEKGQIVKKDDPLAIASTTSIDLSIKKTEKNIEYAKMKVWNKSRELKRANTLKKEMSEEDRDDAVTFELRARIDLEILESTLKTLNQKKKERYTVRAPYDCRVVERYLAPNSGLEYGTDILDIEKTDTQAVLNKAKAGD